MIKLSIKTEKWIRAAAIRAVKTVAQTAVGVIGASAVMSSVDWKMVISAAVLSGITSVLTSVAGLPEVQSESGERPLRTEDTENNVEKVSKTEKEGEI